MEVVRQWLSEGGRDLRTLACNLGGVSVSHAWKLAQDAKRAAA